jgi:diguanylate cyclase (GGDEF)-like protein
MKRWPVRFTPSPLGRIALGVAALAVVMILLLDLALGLVDDPAARERESRRDFAEWLAVQASRLASGADVQGLQVLLSDAVQRRPGLRSASLVSREDGALATVGPHADLWRQSPDGTSSSATHLGVPILAEGTHWGELQLAFETIPGDGWPAVLTTRRLWWPLLAFVLLLALLRLYLAQVMRMLEPSGRVPERVRHAYDALAEGVVLLDDGGRAVLSNAAFRHLAGGRDPVAGRTLEENDWLAAGTRAVPAEWPWQVALRTGTSGEACALTVTWDGHERHLVVNCSLLLDDAWRARGCLVVFLDRTSIERANEDLRRAVDELRSARDRIERQNTELVRLATSDPLSGCLNRRAFFEAASRLQERLRHTTRSYACVMTDIDHFKSFNDRHGHQVGDEVIKAVARVLQDGVRTGDLVCRYGGEEFCILIPDCGESLALDVAERLRATIEARAGPSIAASVPLVVQASFGIAVARADQPLEETIRCADEALYASKRGGRNRVTLHDPRRLSEAVEAAL